MEDGVLVVLVVAGADEGDDAGLVDGLGGAGGLDGLGGLEGDGLVVGHAVGVYVGVADGWYIW